jgi:tRNA threonylcarbamoyl adenosine modification protein (Sua5/YciO/YrdC/YwlC family)
VKDAARDDGAAPAVRVMGWDEPGLAAAAVQALAAGHCLVCPTDTVYGLAARAADAAAVRRLQRLKGRGDDTPPPVLIADPADLAGLAAGLPPAAARLAAAFWPGPLTLVFDLAPAAGVSLGPGAATVAVRLPAHGPLRALLRQTGPLAVSSANRHGQPPAVTAAEAQAVFGARVPLYIDGGPTPGRTPSAVVVFAGCPGGRLVRPGRLTMAALRAVAPDLAAAGPAWRERAG